MKKLHPKADPQTYANEEHLLSIAAEHGSEASTEEFRRMFGPSGTLPPIEYRHRARAAAYRRWHFLPSLKEEEQQAQKQKSA